MAAVIGQNTDVDAAAEQLVTSSTPVRYGTYIRAMAGNSDKVYVGLSSGGLLRTAGSSMRVRSSSSVVKRLTTRARSM